MRDVLRTRRHLDELHRVGAILSSPLSSLLCPSYSEVLVLSSPRRVVGVDENARSRCSLNHRKLGAYVLVDRVIVIATLDVKVPRTVFMGETSKGGIHHGHRR